MCRAYPTGRGLSHGGASAFASPDASERVPVLGPRSWKSSIVGMSVSSGDTLDHAQSASRPLNGWDPRSCFSHVSSA